jgi:signal transduction histidine kinase
MAKFRARARTVDMLGRQQIAGAATAISELFKNAHDAYATRVEADYYRPEKPFLLRDNGIGMTPDEFKDRWLTLGTESKVGGGTLPYRPPGIEERPIMGEKGIGRLAIARIGPQVLVMTRAQRGDVFHDLVVGFVNWELFELPGINLDEIEIPTRVFPSGTVPTKAQITELTHEFHQTLRGLSNKVSPERLRRIEANVEKFVADPESIDAFFNSGDAVVPGETPLTLRDNETGTHFLIQPADDFLGDEIDRDPHSDGDPTFTKFLVGFANTMVPGANPPRVLTRFRDWRVPEAPSELIGGGAFLTADDFGKADHHFSGRFDEFGQFQGEVRIYDQPAVNHIIPWGESQGQPTLCGSFHVDFAHLQGAARESRVPLEDWQVLYRKLERFGGLYIYRDGIRILPYGNSDYDWLNIETRRNKSQGYYFFAYRRIFGAVELTQRENAALVEKAGREGFQTNKAYRQFTSILENFLIQLAADFFREGGAKAAVYSDRKTEIERIELARRKREESISGRKKAFAANLESFFARLQTNEPQRDVDELFQDVERSLNNAKAAQNPDRIATSLIDAEVYAENLLAALRKSYAIPRPRDIGLSTALRREWEAYTSERKQLEEQIFTPAADKLRETIDAASGGVRHLDQRRRVQALIDEISTKSERGIRSAATELRRVADEKQEEIQKFAHLAISQVKDAINSVQAELQRMDLSALQRNAVDKFRDDLQSRIETLTERNQATLVSIRDQLMAIDLAVAADPDAITSGEMTGALEEEVFALRDAADANTELVQLGMALAVVTHEFDAVIRSIRDELKRFKGWANATPHLKPIYERISNNFEHLDGYLALFTPLQRRLYRKPQDISGSEILKFIEDLFSERIRRHKITLTVSPAFRAHKITGYPSTFLPVFVNLIDNAIYWLRDQKAQRMILLDADSTGFLIANTGPTIPPRDREAIFELGFTRKPGGRGMGLYISRHTLAKAGYEISLTQHEGASVCFRIGPNNSIPPEENESGE